MGGDYEGLVELGGAAVTELAAAALLTGDARCANCHAALTGPYCAACGQEQNTHRRSIRHLAHDAFSDLANFDSRILRTARALLLQPGELACAFREGRTQPYVPAIRLYLFVSLIFFLVLSATNIAILQLNLVSEPVRLMTDAQGHPYTVSKTGERVMLPDVLKDIGARYTIFAKAEVFTPIGEYHQLLPPAAAQELQNIRTRVLDEVHGTRAEWIAGNLFDTLSQLEKNPAALNGAITTWIPRVLFVLLPLFALILGLFQIRRRKHFFLVDHLVFSLGYHSFIFVSLLIAVGLAQILPGTLVGWLFIGAAASYLLLAMKRFYVQGWIATALKFAGVLVVYFVFCLAPAAFAVLSLGMLKL